jgi:hypothetical protein
VLRQHGLGVDSGGTNPDPAPLEVHITPLHSECLTAPATRVQQRQNQRVVAGLCLADDSEKPFSLLVRPRIHGADLLGLRGFGLLEDLGGSGWWG